MKKIKRQKLFLSILVSVTFCFWFFFPRYFASRLYDPMEDEFLSVMFSRDVNLTDLLFKAPDYTHPGWWYALMKAPVLFLGIENNMPLFRWIQIIILFVCLAFSFFYFRKKLSSKFLFAFFTLFLSNVYLVHLSIQFRMFAMLLGVATIYSLLWFELIKNKKSLSYKKAILLSLTAILGIFIDYSMIWIIPIWPAVYFFSQKESKSFKKIFLFVLFFLLGTTWFLPVFLGNIQKSLVDNSWLFPHTAKNTTSLILNLFGLIPLKDPNKLNSLVFPYFALLASALFGVFRDEKNKFFHLKLVAASISFIFIVFLLINYFTNNRLFYARAVLPFIIIFYISIADFFSSCTKKLVFKIVFCMIICFQLTQFLIYFLQSGKTFKQYIYFNDQKHPISYFKKTEFLNNSCLITIPYWNNVAAKYFLYSKVNLITIYDLMKNPDEQGNGCDNIYILDQTSIERYRVEYAYKIIEETGYQPKFVDRSGNQELFILEKQ